MIHKSHSGARWHGTDRLDLSLVHGSYSPLNNIQLTHIPNCNRINNTLKNFILYRAPGSAQ